MEEPDYSNEQNQIDTNQNQNNMEEENNWGVNQEVKVEQEKKPRQKPYRLKPDHLQDNKKGLKFLYEQSQLLQKNFIKNKDDDEFKKLDKMMKMIREWHFHLMPKYDFNYFLDRIQNFGTKSQTRAYMSQLRKCHKGQMDFKDLENIDENQENNNNFDNEAPANNQQLDEFIYQQSGQKVNQLQQKPQINLIQTQTTSTDAQQMILNKQNLILNNLQKQINQAQQYEEYEEEDQEIIHEIDQNIDDDLENEIYQNQNNFSNLNQFYNMPIEDDEEYLDPTALDIKIKKK